MIITDQSQIAHWVLARRHDADLVQWAGVASADMDGTIHCAVIYNYPAYENINGHILSDGSRRWMSKAFLRCMFHYPFIQLGKTRITAPVAEGNLVARDFVERLGFVEEGRRRRMMPNGEDQIIYGMLREECRYV